MKITHHEDAIIRVSWRYLTLVSLETTDDDKRRKLMHFLRRHSYDYATQLCNVWNPSISRGWWCTSESREALFNLQLFRNLCVRI